jgi:hypothetical protein
VLLCAGLLAAPLNTLWQASEAGYMNDMRFGDIYRSVTG